MKANRLKSRLLFAVVSTLLLINVGAFHSSSLQWKEYSMISTISRTNRLLRLFGSPATTSRARSCCASFLSMNRNRLNDDDTGNTQTNANFKANNGAQFNIASLINSSISRASSTLSNKSASPIDTDLQSNETRERDEYQDKDGVVEATIVEQTTEKEEPPVPSPEQNRETKSTKEQRSYLDNPAVTPTALAHSLWLEVIRPDDTIIDATAGNGKDSLTLSKLLFSPSSLNSLDVDIDVDGTNDKIPAIGAQLISIDIQKSACDNTISLLRENLDPEIVENSVQVMHQSHAPMPSLPKESVGLICYNLGYLPGTSQEVKKAYTTQMMTTLYSLADSALLIRRGGLLSVMSYPGNGWKEHCAVSYFMEGMAMYTARDKDAWIKFVDAIPNDYRLEQDHMVLYKDSIVTVVDEDDITVRETVRMALDRVKQNGFENQTWRVFDHRPLGRPLSPILFSGMRIK